MQEVWEKEEGLGGNHLRKLLVSTRKLEKFPGNMVRKLILRDDRRKLPLTKPQEEEGFDLIQSEDK